jgi:hypothetical protein
MATFASTRTTRFTHLSVDTIYANSGDIPTLEIKSGGSVYIGAASTISGDQTNTGTVDFTGAIFKSKGTTASLTSATLADGEFAIGAISVTSLMLYYRSGVTTYRIRADIAGAVL